MDDDITYQVLVNGEGQYSLWPADKEVTRGLGARRHGGHQGGVHGARRRGVDRHAATQPA